MRAEIQEDSFGQEISSARSFRGAEGRREHYQFLALLEREWRRPPLVSVEQNWLTRGTSPRASVVLLYWTYFESRMSRLVGLGLQSLPQNVQNDLSSRYDSVTAI